MTQHQAVDQAAAIPVSPLIFGKMVAIMQEVDAIGKARKCDAPGAKFAYRGIDDVYNAVQPLLVKHGIFCRAEVLDKGREERATKSGGALIYTRLSMRYHFMAADGSSVPTEAEGEGMDSGDKSSNKAMAVAHKYAIIQAFCIPTEDIADPDAEAHQVAPKGTPVHNPGVITTEQRDELLQWIKDSGATVEDFCKHWKIEAVPDLKPKDFATALNMLKSRKAKLAAKAAKGGQP